MDPTDASGGDGWVRDFEDTPKSCGSNPTRNEMIGLWLLVAGIACCTCGIPVYLVYFT